MNKRAFHLCLAVLAVISFFRFTTCVNEHSAQREWSWQLQKGLEVCKERLEKVSR